MRRVSALKPVGFIVDFFACPQSPSPLTKKKFLNVGYTGPPTWIEAHVKLYVLCAGYLLIVGNGPMILAICEFLYSWQVNRCQKSQQMLLVCTALYGLFIIHFFIIIQFMTSFQPPIQRVLGAFSLGIRRPERKADHSLPSGAGIKNAWSYTSIPHIASWLGA
jgi:hypothetical protein